MNRTRNIILVAIAVAAAQLLASTVTHAQGRGGGNGRRGGSARGGDRGGRAVVVAGPKPGFQAFTTVLQLRRGETATLNVTLIQE